jgi:hypothetical protein
MISETDLEILRKLSKSLSRLEPHAVKRVIFLLTEEENRAEVLDWLSKETDPSRRPQKRRREDAPGVIRNKLLSMSKLDPERSSILLSFFEKLFQKSVLPTLRDIKAFSGDNCLGEIRGDSREKALLKLFTALDHVPTGNLSQLFDRLPTDLQGDRSLEGWSRVILGNKVHDNPKSVQNSKS